MASPDPGPSGRADRVFAGVGLSVATLFLVALAWVLVAVGGAGGHGAGAPADVFLKSSAFWGLVGSSVYLAALGAWAWWRRLWTFFARQVTSAAAMLALVVAFLAARGGFAYNGHDWNRSFGDASVILYAVTLAIGPLARLWRPAAQALAWRRETAIWGTVAAVLHVVIFWEWSLGWDWRDFFYPGAQGPQSRTLVGDPFLGLEPSAFNLANAVGVVALAYAVVLTVTSNDVSQRWLRTGWSWLMNRATTMEIHVLLHTWLFAYYITREEGLVKGTLWTSFWLVLLLQTAAFIKTVWFRRAARAGGATGRAARV